jgi:hypothetical protein
MMFRPRSCARTDACAAVAADRPSIRDRAFDSGRAGNPRPIVQDEGRLNRRRDVDARVIQALFVRSSPDPTFVSI